MGLSLMVLDGVVGSDDGAVQFSSGSHGSIPPVVHEEPFVLCGSMFGLIRHTLGCCREAKDYGLDTACRGCVDGDVQQRAVRR